jgi:hypothetical protein
MFFNIFEDGKIGANLLIKTPQTLLVGKFS